MTEGTILIANRGEIAVRIIRAARELGLRTLQAHSSADAGSLAVRLADAAIDIGPAPAAKSYLRIDGLIAAARQGGATAVHPGYGFLSESAAFAAAVEAAGLAWIGPSPEAIRRMGDKAAARATAMAAGVPTVPGSDGPLGTAEEATAVAAALGYPVMVKAAAGGGGRGIRIARDPGELLRLWPQAAAEAQAAFGDGALYLERLIEHARHVEVQILGDGQRVIHLFERECSLQRRRQKLWEEAPSPVLPDAIRDTLCASAVALAEAVGYRGAGTVEYLYDEVSGRFYFIEMNTRIQVEHPVTEMITGIDLVREQIRVGLGADLGLTQAAVRRRGHALEVRLNAEDPARGFLPRPGRIDHLELPGGPGVRVDTMLFPGYTVPPYYDSLLAKLIVWGEDRGHALARLERALAELRIEGVPTTAGLHRALAADPEVRAGRFHSTWLEGWLAARPPG